MSISPAFATAPRIKLRIGDQLIAYAIGFNFNVSVDVQPVFVLGSYAPVSLEPTLYNTVTGTLQIVRLKTPKAQQSLLDVKRNPTDTNSNIVTNGSVELGSTTAVGTTNNPLSQSTLFSHLTPSQLILSQSFDLDLYMKVPTAQGIAAMNSNGALPLENSATNKTLDEVKWMTIKNCRFTSRNTNISQGQLVNEPLNFQGLLANNDGDGFTLDSSVKEG
jgi:hypothetical protein